MPERFVIDDTVNAFASEQPESDPKINLEEFGEPEVLEVDDVIVNSLDVSFENEFIEF